MKITTKQLLFILENTPATQNIMLMGKHGIGKSRILEDYFTGKNAKVVTLFLGQMSDPGDLIGLPEKNEKTGKTDFMLPYWFPLDDEPIVLFLDELNRARPEVLQTVMDLTLNRKLAGKSLPTGSRIISAVNNGSEYQLTDLDPALVSRFNIYEFAPSVEDWISWAESSGVDNRVISFIKNNPEYLDDFSDDFSGDNLKRNPDRRSWERVSNILKSFQTALNDELIKNMKVLVSGIIGDQVTSVFFQSFSADKSLSVKQLLTEDFNSVSDEVRKLSLSQIVGLNNGIFKFLEAMENQQNLGSKYSVETISNNLNQYFDLLFLISKEYQMQFISLCSAQVYPKALAFIVEQCGDLYKKILAVVK